MKKLFIAIVALIGAMTMSAQITADVTLRLQSQSGSVCELYMFAGPDLATTPERGSFMPNASNPEDVNIYAIDPANGNRYASFGNETLVNIPVGIITSKEEAAKQNYTIHFEVYENAYTLKLKDLVTGTETTISDGGSYAFTIATATDPSYVEGSYSTIADRFVINYDPLVYVTSVTTNADGWASFAYTADVVPAYPAGLTAYKGALNTTDPDNMVVDLTAVSAIPAYAGVFVHGAANTTYYFSAAASAPALTGNQIVGCTDATDPAGITKAIYTLRNVGGTTALYQYVGTVAIPAGKAYLPIAISAGAPARIAIRVAQPTDVREVEATVKAEKFMEDGKIFIRRGDNIYNLQGQKVN